MAEQFATIVSTLFLIDPERLCWVEHYPARHKSVRPHALAAESYDLVEFEWDGSKFVRPDGSHTTREQIEELVGERL